MTRAKLDSQNIGARRSLRAHVVPPFFPFHPTEEAPEAQSAHCEDMPTAAATEQPGWGTLLTQRCNTLTSPGHLYTLLDSRGLFSASEDHTRSEVFIEGPHFCGHLCLQPWEEPNVEFVQLCQKSFYSQE